MKVTQQWGRRAAHATELSTRCIKGTENRAEATEAEQRGQPQRQSKAKPKENGNEEKIIKENFVNDAAEYFHKHQNFANKWLHLLTMPMLIFTGQCYLQRYEIPVPEYMVDMAYDLAKKYYTNQ